MNRISYLRTIVIQGRFLLLIIYLDHYQNLTQQILLKSYNYVLYYLYKTVSFLKKNHILTHHSKSNTIFILFKKAPIKNVIESYSKIIVVRKLLKDETKFLKKWHTISGTCFTFHKKRKLKKPTQECMPQILSDLAWAKIFIRKLNLVRHPTLQNH